MRGGKYHTLLAIQTVQWMLDELVRAMGLNNLLRGHTSACGQKQSCMAALNAEELAVSVDVHHADADEGRLQRLSGSS